MASPLPALGKVTMYTGSKVPCAAAACFFFLSLSAVAQTSQDDKQPAGSSSPAWYNPAKYNPIKLIRRGPKSANDQLASNEGLEQRLTSQLQAQGVLAKDANLQDTCSSFKALADCVAVLRASHNLKIEFACLKWDVTGVKPASVSDSCAGPSDRKAMSFRGSIELLKPDCDAKAEASKALKDAKDDIKDASA
jgi:hypothetical protein